MNNSPPPPFDKEPLMAQIYMNILWRSHEYPEGVPICSRYFEAFASTKKKVENTLKKLRQSGHILDNSQGARRSYILGARKTPKFKTALYSINTNHTDYIYMMQKTQKGARQTHLQGADSILRGPKSPSRIEYMYSYGIEELSEREKNKEHKTQKNSPEFASHSTSFPQTKKTTGGSSEFLSDSTTAKQKKTRRPVDEVAEFFLQGFIDEA